jgi:hypothetical protein
VTLFIPQVNGQSLAYQNLRDLDRNASHRDFAETIWKTFASYAESGFQKKLQYDFHQRYWEMYLGFGLLNAGLTLVRKPAKGPDFKINANGQLIHIEATVPTAGTGTDAVPDFSDSEAQMVPSDKIILRMRSAIEDKYRKYCAYSEQNIIALKDAYVLAINGGMIPQSILETDPPRILSALFPLGSSYVTIETSTMKTINSSFHYTGNRAKESGAIVATNLFTSTFYSRISAVIFSLSNAANHPSAVTEVGSDFTVIHNPYATNQIPPGTLPNGREYSVEGDDIVCRRK